MTAALQRPDLVEPPAELRQYQLERRFHEEFGCPSPPLELWPVRKVTDYVLIQRAVDMVEAERNKPDSSTGAAKPATPGTRAAFEQVKAQAQLPPGLPPNVLAGGRRGPDHPAAGD